MVSIDFGGVDAQAWALVLDAEDRPIASGYTQQTFGNSGDFALARYIGNNGTSVAYAGPDQTVSLGSPTVLDGSGSTDPNGPEDIVSYEWDFGDGNLGSGVVVNHVYVNEGIYTVTLTVTDNGGESDSDAVTIDV